MAPALVGDHGSDIAVTSRQFWKMSGSGNDFVFFDALSEPPGLLATPAVIGALCARRTGIGADGVVFLQPQSTFPFVMRYYNRDGTLAEMCGNAALCATRLAKELRIVGDGDFSFDTVSGPVTGRIVDGSPEIDMVSVTEQQPTMQIPLHRGELRVGFARVGVPHLVLLVEDIDNTPVAERGRELRFLFSLRDGANVNFVGRSASGGDWAIRTYERGVEEETLACGTGSVAVAATLGAWGLASGPVEMETRSGCRLVATVPNPTNARTPPVLRGEGRIVFEGRLREINGNQGFIP